MGRVSNHPALPFYFSRHNRKYDYDVLDELISKSYDYEGVSNLAVCAVAIGIYSSNKNFVKQVDACRFSAEIFTEK